MEDCKYILIAGTIKPHYCGKPIFVGDFCNKHFLKNIDSGFVETCIYENVRGSYAGLLCGVKAFKNNYCKKHYKRIEIKKKNKTCNKVVRGEGMCRRKVTIDGKNYCIRHLLNLEIDICNIPKIE